MTRDRKLIAAFSAVALLAGGLVMARAVATPVADDSVLHRTVAGSGDSVTLQFVGDTMLGDGAQDAIDAHGYGWPLARVSPLLDGDLVIANAEAPMTTRTEAANPGAKYSYESSPEAAAALAGAGVDVLGLANNHAMDRGALGLADTVSHSAAAGLTTFGAGQDLSEAQQPLVLETAAGSVGIVAFGENFGQASRATETTPGLVVLSPERVQRGIDLARGAGADWVIAYVHWGDNYLGVNDEQRYWARLLVDAGYDLVVGAGPHISQPIEFIGSVPVAYSLGNFVFGTPGRYATFGTQGRGLVLGVELAPNRPITFTIGCVVTDNAVVDYQPVPCTRRQAAELLPRLNPATVLRGTTGHLTSP